LSEAAPLLEARNLCVARGGVEVLDVPSFRVDGGEFVSLIGPNGAGKSTLLLALMGLVERTAGEVRYRGASVGPGRDGLAARRRMALVMQEPLLFDATVFDNVASGPRLRGAGRKETRETVLAYLERFRLTHLADRSARKLSGGEARRVSLARALAVAPDVVLLDEPFASLDLPTRQAITSDLERTLRDEGTAAVLVTHDQAEALRFSDRLDVMSAGRVVQSGPPSRVMNEPVNAFVASVVGMETILDGVVVRAAGGEIVVAVGGREVDAVGDGAPGDAVYCCIRPENVLIEVVDPARTSSARNVFPARIVRAASAGPYLTVRLDCGFPLVAHVTGESYATLALAEGKDVFASVKATAIHVIGKGDSAARPAHRGADRHSDRTTP
jgi:tungstate transport system ATP-binding protein